MFSPERNMPLVSVKQKHAQTNVFQSFILSFVCMIVSLQRFMLMECATCGVALLTAVTWLQAEAEAGCFVVTLARTNMKKWTSLLKVHWLLLWSKIFENFWERLYFFSMNTWRQHSRYLPKEINLKWNDCHYLLIPKTYKTVLSKTTHILRQTELNLSFPPNN